MTAITVVAILGTIALPSYRQFVLTQHHRRIEQRLRRRGLPRSRA